jgi:hypothetical protein
MSLNRYHEVQLSSSGVWRILRRFGAEPAAGLPAPQAPRPALKVLRAGRCPATGCSLTCRFIASLPGSRRKHFQFTAIDDCTRLRVLRSYDRCNQQTVIQFLDYVPSGSPSGWRSSRPTFKLGVPWIADHPAGGARIWGDRRPPIVVV